MYYLRGYTTEPIEDQQSYPLRGGPMNMFCDITNNLEVDPTLLFSIHKYDLETAHILRIDFTVKEEASCVQQLNFLSKKHFYMCTFLTF